MNFDNYGFCQPNDNIRKSFRCKPLSELDMDNYILFAGTSHTEGAGVDVEQSYPYLLSKYFNCDYFNLSISGTGTDVIEHNLLTWSYLFKDKQPKYLIVELAPEERYAAWYPDSETFISMGPWSEKYENVLPLFTKGKEIFHNKMRMTLTLIPEIFKCPIFYVRYGSLPTPTEYHGRSSITWIHRLDIGTDGKHPGIKSHEQISNNLIEQILAR